MSGAPRLVAVVTGARADFGLLEPVMRAIDAHDALDLRVLVAGAHLLPPALTEREVARRWPIAARIPMQRPDETTRSADAAALGRGVEGFARAFADLRPGWVVVLGDRIEAFAAASAASVGGVALAHIHGGDRAEGVADEAMRHAITKLAHLHLPATRASAERIERMGEDADRIHVVGSPALDDLAHREPLDEETWRALGSPEIALLLHPVGRSDDAEEADARAVLDGLAGARVLALMPNHDPGRDGIVRALGDAQREGRLVGVAEHLPRATFLGLVRRLAHSGGALVGNSSAGLIEAAALRAPVVDIGPRQGGRERAGNVVHAEAGDPEAIARAVIHVRELDLRALEHPLGDGRAGPRIARTLALVDPSDPSCTRKRNAY